MTKRKSHTYYDVFESPFGTLYLIFSGEFLTGVSFKKPVQTALAKNSAPESLKKDLRNYFKGINVTFGQKINFLKATDFDKKVWNCLREIPFGETRSYKWVAEKINSPAAVRAVGRALSRNPLPIILPCHRVIEADGSIGGYSPGIDIKRRLLEMEYYAKINRE
ncbi:MAG: methylated-DNA--[protein]-cysteine S-methyltransferase [Nitrospirae bacterium]|nr:methylated-DNA--[protein]-cysteine S-methyltransferase [Nitrospirota bacterium]